MITANIDDQKVQVQKGVTVLEAAKKVGVKIPALCYHEALSPYGACRLCLVEVIRGKRSRITTSCNYPILRDDEVIKTDSEKILRTRRMVMELILARCPGSGLIRDMAYEMGVKEARFRLEEDGNNCILCGLCVRVCDEVIGASAISFVNRGTEREVSTPFHVQSDTCIGCGACAYICPTDVIKVQDTKDCVRTINYLNTSIKLRKCGVCGRCFSPEIQLKSVSDKMRDKVPLPDDIFNTCEECRRRGFGSKVIALEGGRLKCLESLQGQPLGALIK